ncbi:efflux RND transporter periplasmic adaptor subunit [Sorangium sp. So ce861]|uniref:efflux RND transporter periplasmic adaptor subunit n=1 Tax=Sorangium sp. So ce861 TaxID=3133323 RepID=UPI003F5F0E97
MSDAKVKLELTRAKIAALAGGLLLLLAAAVTGTLLVDHSVHDHDAEEHQGHDHGEPKETAHGHDEHGHGEHEERAHGHGEHEEGAHEEGKVKLSPEALNNARLKILTAGPGKVADTVSLPGEVALNAETLAHVTPRVSGTAREVRKQLGDTVKKGDVLAILDSREFAELQRELLTAKERLELAEANFNREEALWKEKIAAEKEYLASKQALAEAKIEHRSAAQKLQASSGAGSGAKGGAYALIAPIDGTIIEKHINIGEVLKDDTQAFVVADLSTIWVNVTVYAKDLARVRAGQRARVRAEGIEEPAEGEIAYVGPVVGEQTRSATARVVLKNPGAAWRPGLFVTAAVAVAEVDAPVVVSYDGLQRVEGKDVVFVQEGDAFEARAIKPGRYGKAPGEQGAELVEVLDGIAAGERYVGKNSFILKAELGKSEAGHDHAH